jgi:multiple sugar transport system permease protein
LDPDLSPLKTLFLLLLLAASGRAESPLELRAYGVPQADTGDVGTQALLETLDEFHRRHPNVRLVSPIGLQIPGRTWDLQQLMQIAGDVAPHVMYVNFRMSDTFIQQRFLYPLDRYIERTAGVTLTDGHLLELDEYLRQLARGPNYASEIAERVAPQCWPVMRRVCPYGTDCPHLREWQAAPAARHQHVWGFPMRTVVMALFYRKDLFNEAGLPDRAPETMDEMFEWARRLTNPKQNRFGLRLHLPELSWATASFLYSMGGRMVEQDAAGQWRCVFDSEAAVEAYHYMARLFHEPFENPHGRFSSVVYTGEAGGVGQVQTAMDFNYLNAQSFYGRDLNQWGFGPVPKSPTGERGSELNSVMLGIFAGLEEDPVRRDLAWEYIRFYDGPIARRNLVRKYVENGLARFMQPSLLREAGYAELAAQVPPGWEEAYHAALENGVPEPYGKNCQYVYSYLSKALDQIRTDPTVRDAVRAGQADLAKARIREILKYRAERTNERMLGLLSPEERTFRTRVALAVAVAILLVFTWVFYKVFQTFGSAYSAQYGSARAGHWQFRRYPWAYLMLLPALLSIALWAYYPLARGTVIAFQDYNVRGFSRWVGMENFATVLFDPEFWYAVWIALKYGALYILFGFWTPIALAFLLTEVPRGKILFRTIFYLPAVLSGVVTIFLWKGFYGTAGMINQVLNFGIRLLNHLPGVELSPVTTVWLDSPQFALFFCLLPTVWAGMGPGCLIYLAALKTVPEEIYEAADVDGAGILTKVFQVAIPNIRALIAINFIGAMVGVIHSGGGFILAMTGGGPYTPYGQTEVIGLHIFWQAFGYLRFGAATAMAWILGAMLIGFTVIQLRRLSRMEFRTAGK